MPPLTKEEARELALQAALERWKRPLAIQDELTREFELGWVFIYNTPEFVNTRRSGSALFGNAPLIVSRDGRVTWTGTSHGIDDYVAAYMAIGPERFDEAVEEFILERLAANRREE